MGIFLADWIRSNASLTSRSTRLTTSRSDCDQSIMYDITIEMGPEHHIHPPLYETALDLFLLKEDNSG